MSSPTPTVQPAVSAECTGARQLDWPEMHARCAGNSVLRVPGVPVPVLTYTCGCTCHRKDDAR